MSDTTIFLRFPDEAAFRALLPEGFAFYGEMCYPLPDGILALSVIGDKYTGGTYDPDTGEVLTPPTKVPGYHVNALVPATVVAPEVGPDTEEEVTPGSVTAQVPPEWAAYQVFPASPDRIFG